jgi:hypothetical protein
LIEPLEDRRLMSVSLDTGPVMIGESDTVEPKTLAKHAISPWRRWSYLGTNSASPQK